MHLHLEIPDALATQLGLPEAEIGRAVLEGFAIEAFREGRLSTFQVRNLLHHASRWETQAFLTSHEAWPEMSTAEILADAATAGEFAAA